ncbi:MAG: zinc ribbon domain-containing protein [marine benthic group bacterium]|nr:zinc ribbon domain-containing protein [Gemmatimonadota bacterium]
MSDDMRGLLTQRLTEEGMPPEIPISVAELHRRLLPYPLCRDRLGFASKGEYDVGFLRLLVDDDSLQVPEAALREAVRDELNSPEPGLALLQRFAASEVRLRRLGSSGLELVEEPSGIETGPPISDLETGRSRGDHIPGLDDPLLVPQDESADALGRLPGDGLAAPTDAPEPPAASGHQQPCRSCRTPLPDRAGARFCPHCGADQERWPCPACGEEVERGWSYCALCGKMLPT